MEQFYSQGKMEMRNCEGSKYNFAGAVLEQCIRLQGLGRASALPRGALHCF